MSTKIYVAETQDFPLPDNGNLRHRNISGTATFTELGAQRIGVIQSLRVTCKLQGVNPYAYLVDVLQRVGQHPAKRVVELAPAGVEVAVRGLPVTFGPRSHSGSAASISAESP